MSLPDVPGFATSCNELRRPKSVRPDVYFDAYNLACHQQTENHTVTKFIAIYCRISSASQSLRSQEGDLQRWADQQTTEVRWYRDVCTGSTMQRPALDRLLADVAAGQVERIVVWRLDRLGRNCSGLVKLFDDLRAASTGLISLTRSISKRQRAGSSATSWPASRTSSWSFVESVSTLE